MNKLRFYILCTRGIPALKRHARMWDGTYSQQITKDDVCYVINTRDDSFRSDAVAWLTAEGIEYHITESNGGPSKGKNSVLDVFLASDDDYMVYVDGDDMITPHGIHIYRAIANPDSYGGGTESPPDVICLEYQYGIIPNEGYSEVFKYEDQQHSASVYAEDRYNQECIHGFGYRCFLRPSRWWENAMAGEWIQKGSPFLDQLSDEHKKLLTREYKYINKWESHCRVTWYSKAAAAHARFKEDIIVGEDVLNYLDLKDGFQKGNLVMRTLNETYPTYVYDQRVGGIVMIANDMNHGRGYLDWMNRLNSVLDEYDSAGKLHEDLEIPYVEIPEGIWAEYNGNVYKPDTLGLVSYPARVASPDNPAG